MRLFTVIAYVVEDLEEIHTKQDCPGATVTDGSMHPTAMPLFDQVDGAAVIGGPAELAVSMPALFIVVG